jgi:hypothetical protein
MASNTVEATLTSRYADGVNKGVEQTASAFQNSLHAMQAASGSFFSAVNDGVSRAVGALQSWAQQLRQKASESEGHFKQMSLGAAAFVAGLVGGLLLAGKAIVSSTPRAHPRHPNQVGLLRPPPSHNIQTRSFGEPPEIPVPRQQPNVAVDATLRDQGVPKPRLSPLRQHLRSQRARPLPIPGLDLHQRQFQ